MHLIIHIDARDLERVEIIAAAEERQQAHSLYESLRAEIAKLDAVAKAAAAESDGQHQK